MNLSKPLKMGNTPVSNGNVFYSLTMCYETYVCMLFLQRAQDCGHIPPFLLYLKQPYEVGLVKLIYVHKQQFLTTNCGKGGRMHEAQSTNSVWIPGNPVGTGEDKKNCLTSLLLIISLVFKVLKFLIATLDYNLYVLLHRFLRCHLISWLCVYKKWNEMKCKI